MDFVQTMKDWKRMCNAMGAEDEYSACEGCKLGDFGCPAIYENECDGADWNRVENVVTQWAAEHPGPVYPTWGDFLYEQGVLTNKMVCGMRDMIVTDVATSKVNDPIPADIAEKLGLKPKELTP